MVTTQNTPARNSGLISVAVWPHGLHTFNLNSAILLDKLKAYGDVTHQVFEVEKDTDVHIQLKKRYGMSLQTI